MKVIASIKQFFSILLILKRKENLLMILAGNPFCIDTLITAFCLFVAALFDENSFDFLLLRNFHLQIYPNHVVYATD